MKMVFFVRFIFKCIKSILGFNGFLYILSLMLDSDYGFNWILCVIIPMIIAVFSFEAERLREKKAFRLQ
ncbi:MAG: hypothetical protein J6I96_00365 [Oscillospiraceae bacterium]|nr:hypothetical protein [Oscillospiraceae bacterium]